MKLLDIYSKMFIVIRLLMIAPLVVTFQQSDYKIKFERIDLVRYNNQCMYKAAVANFKYNRTQAAVNLTLDIKVNPGNNVQVQVQAYRFASNEYRIFPVRYMFGYCDAVAKNDYGFHELYNCGNLSPCPMKKGNYTVCNWAINPSRFPPYIPNGSYMIELTFFYNSMEGVVLHTFGTVYRTFP